MKSLNEKFAQLVHEYPEENFKSGQAAVEYMENSTAIYKGIPVACLYAPKLFSADAWDALQKAAEAICGILDKVIRRYLGDPQYRKLFPFPKELEELILTDAGYPRLLPIARLDIFFNEEDYSFKFCEFNADGASAMNEDREINIALQQSHALQEMRKDHEITTFEFFDSWVREFADIYSSYANKVESPRIVITDFMEGATSNEFIQFQKAFRKAGYTTDICEIRDFSYSGGKLRTPDGKQVDAIYRRAVTRDILDNIDAIPAFLQAARDNAVCLVGHFRTQIIHNKAIFRILRMPETLAFLTESEQEYVLKHIPETLPLKTGAFDLQNVLENKQDWIIKPEDLYGSRGVFAGVDMSPEDWRAAVESSTDTDYQLQKFCPPYKTPNMDFNANARPKVAMYNNITGMFIYNGKLQGIYSRAGLMGTISPFTNGMTLASMLVR